MGARILPCRPLKKEYIRAWGFEQQAVSPTFGLVQQYQLQEQTIYHMDLYRLEHIEEALGIGIEEYLEFPRNSFFIKKWRAYWALSFSNHVPF